MSDSEDLRDLTTEDQNPASADLDTKSALEIAHIINLEDAKVAGAVECELPQIARAIDAVGEAIANGGRLIYVGAGTSGRIAALDAAECPPTFDTDPETVQFVMAGGEDALWNPLRARRGFRRIAAIVTWLAVSPARRDVMAGIAASGHTPYTLAAVEYARSKGQKPSLFTCNPGTPLGRAADIEIVVEVGPEVLAGSTRMKAGTAQNMYLQHDHHRRHGARSAMCTAT